MQPDQRVLVVCLVAGTAASGSNLTRPNHSPVLFSFVDKPCVPEVDVCLLYLARRGTKGDIQHVGRRVQQEQIAGLWIEETER